MEICTNNILMKSKENANTTQIIYHHLNYVSEGWTYLKPT